MGVEEIERWRDREIKSANLSISFLLTLLKLTNRNSLWRWFDRRLFTIAESTAGRALHDGLLAL